MLKHRLHDLNIRDNEYNPENQYLNLIDDILNYGEIFNGRNGSTKAIFGSCMYFNLENNTIPILTTKQMAWRTCAKELFWFIKGSTSNTELQRQNVKIWNENASREFLDSRGLTEYPENDLGPIYGFQWRHFNANYRGCDSKYIGDGVDQLQSIIDTLKNPDTRNSRRLILTAWNPCQLDEMALPPCHLLCQFNVTKDKYLSCSLYQRSGDVGLGVPFNIMSYSLLTYLVARCTGLEPYEFIYNLGNAHIYSEHIDLLKQQIERKPNDFPKIKINKESGNIEDYSIDDIEINDYNYLKAINLPFIK
tara:strand:- start:312 stop:1229 length:918 start_codon:yes stop_codon:yes gene_type:complete